MSEAQSTSAAYLATAQAASYIGLSKSTLEKKRISGDGPRYLKLGKRVVYATDALDMWARSQERSSTSQVIA